MESINNYSIIVNESKHGIKLKQYIFKNTTLEKALQQATKKGQIIEVFEVDDQDNPIVEVAWKHLYYF